MHETNEIVPPDLMSLAEVARRCGVALMTARSWPKGIRVGGQIVRMECYVIGTRCKVSEEQLLQFQANCHKAMFGDAPPMQETPSQEQRRIQAACERVRKMLS
ncbi:hypothetical protein [Limnoglobus roseus]|uniref:Uncharacterized protein n=1 Tax=Limnoglobus roseus TaxID=2598579 RepID=A0A5C1A6N8_9BACT|nr:hypothetical protein [Limnoglobus roseus]QEL14045.1 hypothetical protein PX52LOC_00908 [Limnoglobus roseus]